MPVSPGQTMEGTVTKVLPYGVIVSLPEEQTGLVHISEISHDFVNDIGEYLHEGDVVDVLVMDEKDPGRFELSIKRAQTTGAGDSGARRPTSRRVSEDFEQRLTEFMKQSNRRQSELRRSREARRGG